MSSNPAHNEEIRKAGDRLLSHDDAWEIIRAAQNTETASPGLGSFNTPHPLVGNQINSQNEFITKAIPEIIQQNSPVSAEVVHEHVPTGKWQRVRTSMAFGRQSIKRPVMTNGEGFRCTMLPNMARIQNFSQSGDSQISCQIRTNVQEYDRNPEPLKRPEPVDAEAPAEAEEVKEEEEPAEPWVPPEPVNEWSQQDNIENIHIGKMPVMIMSDLCSLRERPWVSPGELGECRQDHGGQFIINGGERVVVSHEQMAPGVFYVFQGGRIAKQELLGEVKSSPESRRGYMKNQSIKIVKKVSQMAKFVQCNIPRITNFDIPLFVLMRALGFEDDKTIVEMIVGDVKNPDNRQTLQQLRASLQERADVKTQAAALDVLLSHNTGVQNVDDDRFSIEKAREAMVRHLQNELLPHLGTDLRKKAAQVAWTAHEVLRALQGERGFDDRDSQCNKRIELPGHMLAQLFQQIWTTKMLRDVRKSLRKELKKGAWVTTLNFKEIVNMTNIQKLVKTPTIEAGMKQALATGNFSVKSRDPRPGVSQVLSRMNADATNSHLRRVVTPVDKNVKLIMPRKLHRSAWGFICPAETPEGSSIGIVKNFASMLVVTEAHSSVPARDVLADIVKPVDREDWSGIRDESMVFVNGDWVGTTENPMELQRTMVGLRRRGMLHPQTSVFVREGHLHVMTDAGRALRPLIPVDGGVPRLTKEVVARVAAGEVRFDELFLDPTGEREAVLEQLDANECSMALIAEDSRQLVAGASTGMRQTHMELHPATILGTLASSIPQPDHNQSPRNTQQAAMGKQAIGVPATNFLARMDTMLSVLTQPQKPLVQSRQSTLQHNSELPNGINAIVAIGCQTGQNQEDSVVVNAGAIQRGLFHSFLQKTQRDDEKRNALTGEDEKFCKPDFRITEAPRAGNYSKLRESGFPAVNEWIEGGDVIMGKVSPIKRTRRFSSAKTHRDISVMVKQGEAGQVDKIQRGVNGDGQKSGKVRIRIERIPVIADKFSCYTDDHEVLTTEGWVGIANVTEAHRVATLVDGKRVVQEHPHATQKYEYSGPLYVVETNQVSLRVTPNHNLQTTNRTKSQPQRLQKAEELAGKPRCYLKNAEAVDLASAGPASGLVDLAAGVFRVPGVDDLPVLEIDLEAWLTLFGIWMAEGCLLRDWGIEIAAHKDRVKAALSEFELTTGIEFKKHLDRRGAHSRDMWCINDQRFVRQFMPYNVGAVNKHLPEWVWELPQPACRTLIHGMCLGDGHTMANGTRRYDTSSTRLADDFQRLCLHAGWSCNKTLKYAAGHEAQCAPRDEVFRSTADAWRLTIVTSQNRPVVNKTKSQDEFTEFTGHVYCCSVTSGVIQIRHGGRVTWCGNSRHGQKGTIGAIIPEQDMPMTAAGIRPDIIINPHAIPSRMTIAQLVECILGKAGAARGSQFDSMPFTDFSLDGFADLLEEVGMNRQANETLYNGVTGDMIDTEIFIGPTFQQRLKHMVDDKVHSRSTGPIVMMTRQPAEGRAHGGGLRIGEMEKDCCAAHGMGLFTVERLSDLSDKHMTHFSKQSGLEAIMNREKGIVEDTSTGRNDNVVDLEMPFAMSLLMNELSAMSIRPRIVST